MDFKSSPVAEAMRSLRGGFLAIALFSLVLNLLMLAGPLYMLQVYDRVLTSQSMETLIALSILLAGVFVVSGCLDFIRLRILSRLGARFELKAGTPILEAVMRKKVDGKSMVGDNTLADVNAFRDFLSGSTLIAFFDAPWVPIYIAILFVLHPYLGWLGLAGALTLLFLAMVNNSISNKPMQKAAAARHQCDGMFETCERNSELIHSMGMKKDLAKRWAFLQFDTSRFKTQVTDRISTITTISKTFRMALQSGILGLGAALAITGQTTAGVMIAATIILGRALAPIDQAIGNWRTFIAAIGSYRKLKQLIIEYPEEKERLSLADAASSLSVAIKKAGPPLSENATISDISFKLEAGDVVAVIGPSGSGKSTLARMLTGVWYPQRGKVSLDGTATDKWNHDQLGRQIGYLPQDVELFEGTIKENISRFSAEVDDRKVLKAAVDADVHEMILGLPEGYETRIGKDGFFLSGGQRQRLGLARALYGEPFVIVLDEPNSNLDATGDSALRRAVNSARSRGAITVVMTHRPSALQAANKVLVLERGMQSAFGDKEEILRGATRTIVNNAQNNVQQQENVSTFQERVAK
ncbi:MAG: type I secretion system permease/ATPase [Rhizobiaceae bacterium]|nr:type I secretion system permease/ATPase [Rhizobiaceae bacterium]